jgi:hypothetical protein
MTSGFYPVNPKSESSFSTTYDTMMNAPPFVPKSLFTPGYQGHLPGVKHIIGQSCPAGNPTSPDFEASQTIKPVDSFAPVHQRARSEQPLNQRKTSRNRSPTPKHRKFFFPESLGGSYVPPAYRGAVLMAGGARPRPELPSPRALAPKTVTPADGRGTGYDAVRSRGAFH